MKAHIRKKVSENKWINLLYSIVRNDLCLISEIYFNKPHDLDLKP